MLRMPMSSPLMPISEVAPPVTIGAAAHTRFTPTQLRIALIGSAVAIGVLGYVLTQGEAASRAALDAGAELTRLLRMMALLKVTLGVGALALVSLRFRFPISTPLAASYIAAGGVMAAGPGLIWNMAHVALGALLLHGGLAALFCLALMDGGPRWTLRLGRS
jgi:hypothetical protein